MNTFRLNFNRYFPVAGPMFFCLKTMKYEKLASITERQFRMSSSECTVSRELLWLCRGESSGTQERELEPLEAGTRGLVMGQQTGKTQGVHIELQTVGTSERARL
jgi:hypothetical protein